MPKPLVYPQFDPLLASYYAKTVQRALMWLSIAEKRPPGYYADKQFRQVFSALSESTVKWNSTSQGLTILPQVYLPP